jgi:hypothetical protein
VAGVREPADLPELERCGRLGVKSLS